jgi:hypothetical protein
MTRFDQCTVTCTTDCGHCKGDPVGALRTDLERLARRLAGRFEETEHLRAELEAARPVVEAADALRTVHSLPVDTADAAREVEYLIDEATSALAEAVDLYRSATTRNLDSALPDPSLDAETLPTTEEKP